MTFGCCVQTIRFAEAYLVLVEQGLTLEARTAARAALEFAATIEFAYLRKDGLDMLSNSAERASWSLEQRMDDWLGYDGPPAGPQPIDGPRLPKLSTPNGIFAALDPDNRLLGPGYAILSQGTHVTNETLTAFFRKTPDKPGMWLNVRRHDEMAEYTRVLVAQSCMLVSWIFARTADRFERLEALEASAKQLHLPTRLDKEWPDELRTHLD